MPANGFDFKKYAPRSKRKSGSVAFVAVSVSVMALIGAIALGVMDASARSKRDVIVKQLADAQKTNNFVAAQTAFNDYRKSRKPFNSNKKLDERVEQIYRTIRHEDAYAKFRDAVTRDDLNAMVVNADAFLDSLPPPSDANVSDARETEVLATFEVSFARWFKRLESPTPNDDAIIARYSLRLKPGPVKPGATVNNGPGRNAGPDNGANRK